jgi:hypothetical protein
MPQVGFEHTITASERAKTVHDRPTNQILMTNLMYEIRLPIFSVVLHLMLPGSYF